MAKMSSEQSEKARGNPLATGEEKAKALEAARPGGSLRGPL